MVSITLDGRAVTVSELRALAMITAAARGERLGTLLMDGRPARLAIRDGDLVVEALPPERWDGERGGRGEDGRAGRGGRGGQTTVAQALETMVAMGMTEQAALVLLGARPG